MAARAALDEGPDPHRVPEHDLLRERRLRHPAGGADVLPATADEADARRGRAARGDPERPAPVRPGRRTRARRERRRDIVLRDLLRAGLHHEAPVRAREPRAAAEAPEDVHLPGDEGPAPVLHELREAAAGRQVRPARVFGGGLRVQTTIDLGLQKIAREAISKLLTDPNGPVGGARRDRPAERRRARHGRRQELPQEPVQPRGAGRAPARLVVQAVRARRPRWTQGISPQTTFVSRPVDDPRRRPALDVAQLRGLVHGADRPARRRRRSPTTRSTRS